MYSEARRARAASTPIGGWAGMLVHGLRSALRSLVDARVKTARPALLLEERLALGGNRSVMLVGCHGRRYLLGGSGDSLFLICEVGREETSPLAESNDLSAFAATGTIGAMR